MRCNPGPTLSRRAAPVAQDQGRPRWCRAPRARRLEHDHDTTRSTLRPGRRAARRPTTGPAGRPATRSATSAGSAAPSTTGRSPASPAASARHLDIDPLILRVAFVVLAFFGGAGLLLYGACWLLVPEDGRDRR